MARPHFKSVFLIAVLWTFNKYVGADTAFYTLVAANVAPADSPGVEIITPMRSLALCVLMCGAKQEKGDGCNTVQHIEHSESERKTLKFHLWLNVSTCHCLI